MSEPITDLLEFIHASPTPFHAVAECARRLESAGFTALDEVEPWGLRAGGRHYVTRNDSSIIAFVVGEGAFADHGAAVVGAHTDSPNLRIKPHPEVRSNGYLQIGVEVYGGVLQASWTDRDLGLAGRVTYLENGAPQSRLVHVDRPIARIPQIAIHLDRTVNKDGLKLNAQTHLPPVVALDGGVDDFDSWLAGEAGIEPDAMTSCEVMFHAVEPPTVSGLADEFIHAPRLDNLAMCHAGLESLVSAAGMADPRTRAVVLFDNEEIGSETAQGAAGSFFADVVSRVAAVDDAGPEALARGRARTFVISADMAHAVHPSRPDRHDSEHAPRMNGGPVIKFNANARYATDSESSAAFEALCHDVDVPVQKFVMRSDLACGSTIGPIMASRLGARTVDVGNPMLSMHSAREMAGAHDHELMIRVMTRFFEKSSSD